MSNDIYEDMVQSRGHAYRSDQIKAWSHYREPIDETPGRLAGNSRVWGDASPEVQSRVIDTLIDTSQQAGLSARETAHVLAIARIESGFNPDAAAGTTSASGLGQFIDRTGQHYGLGNQNRFDVEAQANGLVEHFIDNRDLAARRGQGEEYIYKYHHDGPSRDYGGLGLAQREVMPRLDEYQRFVEQRLGLEQGQPGSQSGQPQPERTPAQEREQAVLSAGATGAGVIQLQHTLNAVRGNAAALQEDGRFGPDTQARLEQFQQAAGLDADGVYGPQTRDTLESAHRVLSGQTGGVHRLGDKSSEIADAQRVLSQLGYHDRNGAQLATDGDFGAHTAHAARQFQQANGLDDDGVIGPRTWDAMRDAYAQHLERDGAAQVQPGTTAPGRQQAFNSFDEAMRAMLPAQNGIDPHITSHAGMRTLNGRADLHEGVDFNYVGGQVASINQRHPTIYSPVSGTVIGVTGEGRYGAINIRDANGYEHRILHTHDQHVEAGQTVTAGETPIGTMGGRGPNGADQYAQHVDYRIKDPQGRWINPERYWDEGRDVEVAAVNRLERSDILGTAFANIGSNEPLQTALAGSEASRVHEAQKAQLQADLTREPAMDTEPTRTQEQAPDRGLA